MFACTHRTELIIRKRSSKVVLCLNVAKIKKLVSGSQSLGQHWCLSCAKPSFIPVSLGTGSLLAGKPAGNPHVMRHLTPGTAAPLP